MLAQLAALHHRAAGPLSTNTLATRSSIIPQFLCRLPRGLGLDFYPWPSRPTGRLASPRMILMTGFSPGSRILHSVIACSVASYGCRLWPHSVFTATDCHDDDDDHCGSSRDSTSSRSAMVGHTCTYLPLSASPRFLQPFPDEMVARTVTFHFLVLHVIQHWECISLSGLEYLRARECSYPISSASSAAYSHGLWIVVLNVLIRISNGSASEIDSFLHCVCGRCEGTILSSLASLTRLWVVCTQAHSHLPWLIVTVVVVLV